MEFQARVIGRVGRDAELRMTGTGKQVCSYSVATNPTKDKTIWVRVTTWDRRAEIDAKYVKKGMLIFVEGPIQSGDDGKPRTYEKDGRTYVSNFEMTGYNVKYLTFPEEKHSGSESSFEDVSSVLDEVEEIPF